MTCKNTNKDLTNEELNAIDEIVFNVLIDGLKVISEFNYDDADLLTHKRKKHD